MNEILCCDHSNETSSTVLSYGTMHLVCSSNFWVCGPNPMVWPFKSNLFSSTFIWCYAMKQTRVQHVMNNFVYYTKKGKKIVLINFCAFAWINLNSNLKFFLHWVEVVDHHVISKCPLAKYEAILRCFKYWTNCSKHISFKPLNTQAIIK